MRQLQGPTSSQTSSPTPTSQTNSPTPTSQANLPTSRRAPTRSGPTAQRGPSSRRAPTRSGPTAQRGPSSRRAPTRSGPTAQRGPSSRRAPTRTGPSSRRAPTRRGPTRRPRPSKTARIANGGVRPPQKVKVIADDDTFNRASGIPRWARIGPDNPVFGPPLPSGLPPGFLNSGNQTNSRTPTSRRGPSSQRGPSSRRAPTRSGPTAQRGPSSRRAPTRTGPSSRRAPTRRGPTRRPRPSKTARIANGGVRPPQKVKVIADDDTFNRASDIPRWARIGPDNPVFGPPLPSGLPPGFLNSPTPTNSPTATAPLVVQSPTFIPYSGPITGTAPRRGGPTRRPSAASVTRTIPVPTRAPTAPTMLRYASPTPVPSSPAVASTASSAHPSRSPSFQPSAPTQQPTNYLGFALSQTPTASDPEHEHHDSNSNSNSNGGAAAGGMPASTIGGIIAGVVLLGVIVIAACVIANKKDKGTIALENRIRDLYLSSTQPRASGSHVEDIYSSAEASAGASRRSFVAGDLPRGTRMSQSNFPLAPGLARHSLSRSSFTQNARGSLSRASLSQSARGSVSRASFSPAQQSRYPHPQARSIALASPHDNAL